MHEHAKQLVFAFNIGVRGLKPERGNTRHPSSSAALRGSSMCSAPLSIYLTGDDQRSPKMRGARTDVNRTRPLRMSASVPEVHKAHRPRSAHKATPSNHGRFSVFEEQSETGACGMDSLSLILASSTGYDREEHDTC